LNTDFGKIRVFDTKGNKPVIINVPDGPNVIEHQMQLIQELSKDYRVVCFEYPGIGFSYPSAKYNYSFKSGAELLLQVMDALNFQNVVLLFSCSNGFYAIEAASKSPERFKHIFLSQTPSTTALSKWTEKSIPKILNIPIIGQLANALYAPKFADIWYKYALPKDHPDRMAYASTAVNSIKNGGCFCLSSLVQGLRKDKNESLNLDHVPATLVWGAKDFSHRRTDKTSIHNHIPNCEIIEFSDCGHFPELEKTLDFRRLINEKIA
jgi:pimeloyl-ACP methyl ester carboxylesterase